MPKQYGLCNSQRVYGWNVDGLDSKNLTLTVQQPEKCGWRARNEADQLLGVAVAADTLRWIPSGCGFERNVRKKRVRICWWPQNFVYRIL